MLRTRIIPVLLLSGSSLVKTIRYNKPKYIGDPANTCRIFNELEVDELCFLDVLASKNKIQPSYTILEEISNECFMPLSYGGGINSLQKAEKIYKIGFEKIVINSALFTKPSLVTDIANEFGSQAVVASVDVKKNIWGKYEVYGCSGSVNQRLNPVQLVLELEARGVGEILLNYIDREGTWKGFDLELVSQVSNATVLPVIAHGGAGSISDIGDVISIGKASAAALGSMVVYQQRGMGVLINFPDKDELKNILNEDGATV